jgi:hypothetical protein
MSKGKRQGTCPIMRMRSYPTTALSIALAQKQQTASAATSDRFDPQRPRRRRGLCLSFVPLGVFLLFGLSLRVSLTLTPAAGGEDELIVGDTAFGAAQAQQGAARICRALTGEPGYLYDVTKASAYAPRQQQHRVRIWEVTCEVRHQQYQFRFDADTGQVIGVNNRSLTTDGSPTGGDAKSVCTAEEAREHALRYLAAISAEGIPPVPLMTKPSLSRQWLSLGVWRFHYRLSAGRCGRRLIIVSVDAKTGALLDIYAPVRRNAGNKNTPPAAVAAGEYHVS